MRRLGAGMGCALLLIVFLFDDCWATVIPSCSKLGAPHHEWNDSRDIWYKAIFVGKALQYNKKGSNEFEVQKSWTADTPKNVVVRQDQFFTTHAKFEFGISYLIYGKYTDESYKIVLLDPCAREKPAEKASLELEFLDAASKDEKLEALIKRLPVIIQTHSNPGMREEAINILAKLEEKEYSPEQRVDVVLKALEDSHSAVRAAAAESFDYEGDLVHPKTLYRDIDRDKIIDGLIPLLQDKDWKVREKAAPAMKYVGFDSDRGVPALIAAYEKEKAEPEGGDPGSLYPKDLLLGIYYTALADNRSEKARKYMLPLFRDRLKTGKDRHRVLGFLLVWGMDARALEPDLIELFKRYIHPAISFKRGSWKGLNNPTTDDIKNVLRILGNMRSESVVPLIIQFVEKKRALFEDSYSCELLIMAIRALDAAGTPQALKELEGRLLPEYLAMEKQKKPPCQRYFLESFGPLTSETSKKAVEQFWEIRKQREKK